MFREILEKLLFPKQKTALERGEIIKAKDLGIKTCPICSGDTKDHEFIILAIIEKNQENKEAAYRYIKEALWEELNKLSKRDMSKDNLNVIAIKCKDDISIVVEDDPLEPYYQAQIIDKILLDDKQREELGAWWEQYGKKGDA